MHGIPFPRTDSIEIVEAPISVTPETRSFRDTTLYTLMMTVLKNTAHSEDPLDAVLLDDLIELEASRVMVTTNDGYLEYLDVQYDDWVLIFSNEKPSDRNKGKSSLTIRDRQIGNSINLEAKSLDNLLSGLNSWLAAV